MTNKMIGMFWLWVSIFALTALASSKPWTVGELLVGFVSLVLFMVGAYQIFK